MQKIKYLKTLPTLKDDQDAVHTFMEMILIDYPDYAENEEIELPRNILLEAIHKFNNYYLCPILGIKHNGDMA